MADNNSILSNLYQLVNVDVNSQPTKIKNVYIPPAIGTTTLGGVKADGTTIVIAIDGTITSTAYATVQNASGIAVMQRPIIEFTGSGVASVTDDAVGGRTVVTISGGGGGGAFTSTAIWTGGTGTKNAYTSPGVVNTVGITINLVASSGSGSLTAATVSLNGVALAGTFDSTGTWPNLVISIPSAALTGNAAEIAPTVLVSLTGTFGGTGVNVVSAGTLINNQPIPFTTTLSGSYAVATTPFYTTTGTLNYSYSNSGAIVTFGGQFNPGGSANAATGSFTNLALTSSTISGNATGNGLNGAGLLSVPLSGTVPAVPIYVPAFYVQTANVTVPTFTTVSLQTPGAAAGSIVTFPVAPLRTQYNWICVDAGIALSRILFVSPFGNSPLVPDVGPVAATISSRNFTIYGFTRLDTVRAVQLMITALGK